MWGVENVFAGEIDENLRSVHFLIYSIPYTQSLALYLPRPKSTLLGLPSISHD